MVEEGQISERTRGEKEKRKKKKGKEANERENIQMVENMLSTLVLEYYRTQGLR